MKVAAWRRAYAGIFDAAFLESLDYPQQYWDRHLEGLLVSELAGRVTGYCSYAPADTELWGEIRAIYVHPSFHRMGHGSQLISAGVKGLIGRGFDRALLWVIDRNHAACSFYEAQGWARGAPIRLEEIGGTEVTLIRYELDPLRTSSS